MLMMSFLSTLIFSMISLNFSSCYFTEGLCSSPIRLDPFFYFAPIGLPSDCRWRICMLFLPNYMPLFWVSPPACLVPLIADLILSLGERTDTIQCFSVNTLYYLKLVVTECEYFITNAVQSRLLGIFVPQC